MTKVLVVQDDRTLKTLADELDLYEADFDYEDPFYLKCDNCGIGDAIDYNEKANRQDGVEDFQAECYNCGATIEVSVVDGNVTATGLYCRHRRGFDEDCARCEIEGIDLPQ